MVGKRMRWMTVVGSPTHFGLLSLGMILADSSGPRSLDGPGDRRWKREDTKEPRWKKPE